MAFYGLYYAMTTPVLKAMVVQAAPNDARGRALGIFYFVSRGLCWSPAARREREGVDISQLEEKHEAQDPHALPMKRHDGS
jgi:hypothetical protein